MIKHLHQLVAKGDLKMTIEELKNILSKSNRLNEIIMQSARYNSLKEKIRLGMIDLETAAISENKITFAVLELINEIDEAILSEPSIEQELKLKQSSIFLNQNHSGAGDNIGRDKIINI